MRVGFTTLRLFAAVAEEKNIARRTDHLAHSEENAGPRRNPESCKCGSRAARRFRAKSRPLSRASPRSARGITGQWRLDLDHLRAEISGATGGERPSDKIPYLKNSQSAKRSASRPHRRRRYFNFGRGPFCSSASSSERQHAQKGIPGSKNTDLPVVPIGTAIAVCDGGAAGPLLSRTRPSKR